MVGEISHSLETPVVFCDRAATGSSSGSKNRGPRDFISNFIALSIVSHAE